VKVWQQLHVSVRPCEFEIFAELSRIGRGKHHSNRNGFAARATSAGH
jgi:hypothetical protein